jgi:branched-chain amino acid transport system substrate-binding protein
MCNGLGTPLQYNEAISKRRRDSMRKFLQGIGALVLAVGLGALVGVPQPQQPPIKLGSTLALTGLVSSIGVPMAQGSQAYFNYINDTGGIFGRKIEFIVRDDQYIPSNTVAATRQLVEQDNVFAIVHPLGTAHGLAVMDYLVRQGVPVIAPGSGASVWSKPLKKNYFAVQPTYTNEGRILADFVVDTLSQGKRVRVATFYQNDDFGREGEGAFVGRLLQRGFDPPVVRVAYDPTQASFSAEALKLQEAKPDVVLVYAITLPAARLLKEAQKIDFRPQWVMTYILADPIMFTLAGQDAMEGVFLGAWTADPFGKEPEDVVLYQQNMRKYHGDRALIGGYSLVTYADAVLVVEALKKTIERDKDLTREGFIKTLEDFDNWRTGLIAAPITFSRTDHQGVEEMYIVKATKGAFQAVTGLLSPPP